MDRPLISIVTVSFNAVETIEQTILSVVNQMYPNIEYIVIDGGSTDGTVDIIKKYSDKIAYWVSEPDRGIYDAMNKGIDKATGRWINFMNCGDWFYTNDVIQSVVPHLEKADVFYGNMVIQNGRIRYIVLPESLNRLSEHLVFCHQSAFVRTELLKNNPFDLSYKYVADYALFYRLYKKGCDFLYANITINYYEIDNGATASHVLACLRENHRINHQPTEKFSLLNYKLRSYLIGILPKYIVHSIRRSIYAKNKRFVEIDS